MIFFTFFGGRILHVEVKTTELNDGSSHSQAQKETITCILDCMAHVLTIPKEVEDAFLHRTVKAFTWVRQPVNILMSD